MLIYAKKLPERARRLFVIATCLWGTLQFDPMLKIWSCKFANLHTYVNMLQNVIMIWWKPFNAECLFFVVHLEQHLILPVFHLLERLVLAIIQVLLTDTFSMLINEDYNLSPCWRCWLSIPLRIYTPRGPPPSSLITTLDWFGWWEHYHCSQN